MSAHDFSVWLMRWQGVAAFMAVVGMGTTAVLIHGRDMQRLDDAEMMIREIRAETVTRREFELLLKGIDDLRSELRGLRESIDRRVNQLPR